MFIEKAQSFSDIHAVGLIRVPAVRRTPLAPFDAAACEVAAFTGPTRRKRMMKCVEKVIPRFGVLEERSVSAGVLSLVENLSNADGVIAILAKKLRQRDEIRKLGTEFYVIGNNARLIRTEA
jgi:hypothetical protein